MGVVYRWSGCGDVDAHQDSLDEREEFIALIRLHTARRLGATQRSGRRENIDCQKYRLSCLKPHSRSISHRAPWGEFVRRCRLPRCPRGTRTTARSSSGSYSPASSQRRRWTPRSWTSQKMARPAWRSPSRPSTSSRTHSRSPSRTGWRTASSSRRRRRRCA